MPDKQPPLTLAYEWRTRLMWLAVPLALIAVYVVLMQPAGGVFLLMFALVMTSFVAASIYLNTRAHFQILGDDATVRRYLGTHTIHGPDVVAVREVINGRSPDVKLVLRDGSKVIVPSSRLTGGHSVLLDWLAVVAPDAEFDKGARRIQNIVAQKRGLA